IAERWRWVPELDRLSVRERNLPELPRRNPRCQRPRARFAGVVRAGPGRVGPAATPLELIRKHSDELPGSTGRKAGRPFSFLGVGFLYRRPPKRPIELK